MVADLRNNTVIPFIYVLDITLNANGLGSKNLTLSADSWFELMCYRASTDNDSNSTDFYPNFFSVQITDGGTGRQLQSTKVHQRNICGTAFMGYDEKRAIKFAPNTILQFDFQNLTAEALEIQFGLVGYKYFAL